MNGDFFFKLFHKKSIFAAEKKDRSGGAFAGFPAVV